MFNNIEFDDFSTQYAYDCRKISQFQQDHDQDQASHDSDSTCEDKFVIDNQARLKVKVQLCRNFLENKICPYKSRCKFAHGLEELLQNSQLGQNFRTKKCKIFYDKRYCRFGQRCNFRHNQKQKQFRILTRSPNILQHYPQFFIGIRNKSKILQLVSSPICKEQTNQLIQN